MAKPCPFLFMSGSMRVLKKREMKLTNPQKISSRLLRPHGLACSTYKKREMKLTNPQKISSRLLTVLRPHGLASSTYKKTEMKLTNPQKISSRLLKPHCLSSSTYKREMKLTKPQKMSSRLLRPHGTKPMPKRKIFILFFTAHRGLGFLFYYFFLSITVRICRTQPTM